MQAETTTLSFRTNGDESVSALLLSPKQVRAALVLAHGAGAGMQHPFMVLLAQGLARHGIATLRFQFPYMEKGVKRPDSPMVAEAAIRAAVTQAARLLPGTPLFAGGKSFGGRMTSQAQARSPLPGVRGLVFVGFPLHPAGKPSLGRADHLTLVQLPMLFLQGRRDALADPGLLKVALGRLGSRATLKMLDEADHSFHARKSSGTSDDAILSALTDCASQWMLAVASVRA
jgi:predicted alpha/beta-hydrolase family hydrolase